MNFIIRYFFKSYIKPEDESVQLISLANLSAYQAFTDNRFRELVSFEKQSEEEQGRIFNELAVTSLVLLMSMLEDRLEYISEKRQEFWRKIRQNMANNFTEGLEKMGVERKDVLLWEKLIVMRFKEYEEKKEITSEVLTEEFRDEKMTDKMRNDLARLETLTLSSLLHITRNKAEPDDPLKKHLKGWLCGLYYQLDKKIGW